MSEPDLTDVVEVAARAAWERSDAEEGLYSWDNLSPVLKRDYKQGVLEFLYPVAQMLYDQGKLEVVDRIQKVNQECYTHVDFRNEVEEILNGYKEN